MEPWYKVVTPRKEVREGRSFNPDEFVIALDQVVAGRAPEDLPEIIHGHPREILELLREAGGLTAQQLQRLREAARKMKQEKKLKPLVFCSPVPANRLRKPPRRKISAEDVGQHLGVLLALPHCDPHHHPDRPQGRSALLVRQVLRDRTNVVGAALPPAERLPLRLVPPHRRTSKTVLQVLFEQHLKPPGVEGRRSTALKRWWEGIRLERSRNYQSHWRLFRPILAMARWSPAPQMTGQWAMKSMLIRAYLPGMLAFAVVIDRRGWQNGGRLGGVPFVQPAMAERRSVRLAECSAIAGSSSRRM